MLSRDELAAEWQRVYAGDDEGEAFHGPCLLAILARVDPATIRARPLGGAHSIAEIVAHLVIWREFLAFRTEARIAAPDVELSRVGPDVDWVVPDGTDAEAWQALQARLAASQERLVGLLGSLPDELWAERYDPFRFGIHHDLHHGAQVALLAGP